MGCSYFNQCHQPLGRHGILSLCQSQQDRRILNPGLSVIQEDILQALGAVVKHAGKNDICYLPLVRGDM